MCVCVCVVYVCACVVLLDSFGRKCQSDPSGP